MTVLSGAEFKKANPGPWFKWLREDMTHNGFTYTPGLNIDPVNFNPKGECEPGGLYLIKSIEFLPDFYNYGPVLGIFDVPDNAQVYIEDHSKFKCDRVFLLKTVSSDIDLVSYFKQAVFRCNRDTCAKAAFNGHLEVLKWARDNGCSWDYRTFSYAAFSGHLEILKWAYEKGCELNSCVWTDAAGGGSLDVLKWLKEKGIPWSKDTIKYASENSNFEAVKWLKENGCPEA